MISDMYHTQVVNPHTFSYPHVISNGKFPWILDRHMWFDYYAFSHAGTKRTQQEALEWRDHKSGTKKCQVHEVPAHSSDAATRVVPGVVEGGEIG